MLLSFGDMIEDREKDKYNDLCKAFMHKTFKSNK